MTAKRQQNETPKLARTACIQCRTSKRRCNRTLPSCSLCAQREADCSYPGHQNLNSPKNHLYGDDREFPHATSQTTLSSDTQYIENAVYFISPHLHRQAQLELPRPNLPIPDNLSSLIGEASSVRGIASSFFKSVHPWLPIVSKHIFYTCLLNPLAGRRTELSLLTLSMKLCCTAPTDEERGSAVKTTLYHAVKRLYYEVESAGFLSIHVLQAGILIALYELGQAIYPAAYLTVGACARYGLALNVHKSVLASTIDGYGPLTWNDIEERRRVWWAVLVLDRFLSLSNPARPLSTDDPTFDTYLPVDDAAWDDNTVNPVDATLISTGFTLKMGRFARLAQGTFLLSQAFHLIRPTATKDEAVHFDKMAQLRRTLLALVHAADVEADVRELEFCAQSGLSLSAILLLQEHQLHSDTKNDGHRRPSLEGLWEEARTALDRLSAAATTLKTICLDDPYASNSVPIPIIQAMFQAACVLLLLAPNTLTTEIQKYIETFKSSLRIVNLRWRLAGVYLNVLDTQEVAMSPTSIEYNQAFA